MSPEQKQQIKTLIREQPGLSIAAIREQLGHDVMDALFVLIASGDVYVDLEHQLISEQEFTRVFPSKESAEALQIVSRSNLCTRKDEAPRVNGHSVGAGLKTGSLNLNVNRVPGLESIDPAAAVGGRQSNPSPEVFKLITAASQKDLSEAKERLKVINNPKFAQERKVPDRTIRHWKKQYRWAEETFACGFVGLLRRHNRQGNQHPRLPLQVYEIAGQVITEVYMNPKRVTKMFTYGRFADKCQDAGLPAPSYAWFARVIRKMRNYEVKLAREGKRAAYSMEFPHRPLSAKNDSHGQYPWHIVHIDHTLIDIELVDEATGIVLGRPWLTLMFDAYSRRILAFIITFDPPSANTLKSLLRECVRRHSRLPTIMIHDWGREFGSEFFQTLNAMYEVQVRARPPGKPRAGSPIEREFGTLNKSFFHNLMANTQNTKNVRMLTKSINPRRLAVWSLESLNDLLERFCFEVHDQRQHRGIGTTPADAYKRGMQQMGLRPSRRIEYDETFKFLTMATTPKGTARVQPGLGVKIRYFHYWNEAMRDPQWERKEVPVRYDQDDLGAAFARIGSVWVRCVSHHQETLRNMSEKQWELAVRNLRQKRSLVERNGTITAKQIARFFESVEGEEVLRAQRMKDKARARVREVSNGALVPGAGSTAEDVPPAKTQNTQPPIECFEGAEIPPVESVFEDF